MTLPSDYLNPHWYNIKVPGPVRYVTIPKAQESNIKTSQEFQKRIPQQKPEPKTLKPISRLVCDEVKVMDQPKDSYQPSEKFVKIFRCKNTGSEAWPKELHLRWFQASSNARMECDRTYDYEVALQNSEIKPGGAFSLKIHMTAPDKPGVYFEVWKLVDPRNAMTFGKMLRVQITVSKAYFT